jgi:hypothetical protein
MTGFQADSKVETNKSNPHLRGVKIAPEVVVSFKGLKSKKELNGLKGQVVEYDSAIDRYLVRVPGKADEVSVKVENLQQHPTVTIEGLSTRADLNGCKGSIVVFDAKKDRYTLNVHTVNNNNKQRTTETVSLKPKHVILESCTFVQIVNLASRSDLNGSYATIRWRVKEADRYDVHLPNGETVRVKPENLRV